MIKRIERPDWEAIVNYNLAARDLEGLETWFNKNIEPINEAIDKAVVVKDCGPNELDSTITNWSEGFDGQFYKGATMRALLISIEPIKKETREDKLAQLLSDILENGLLVASGMTEKRAKELLEEK